MIGILEIVNWYVLGARAKYFLAIFSAYDSHSKERPLRTNDDDDDGKLTYFWKDGVNLIFSSSVVPLLSFFYI